MAPGVSSGDGGEPDETHLLDAVVAGLQRELPLEADELARRDPGLARVADLDDLVEARAAVDRDLRADLPAEDHVAAAIVVRGEHGQDVVVVAVGRHLEERAVADVEDVLVALFAEPDRGHLAGHVLHGVLHRGLDVAVEGLDPVGHEKGTRAECDAGDQEQHAEDGRDCRPEPTCGTPAGGGVT